MKLKSEHIADLHYDKYLEIAELYGYEDLRETIDILVERNFEGWKTTGSIGHDLYDDYAIFDDDLIDIKQCKMLIDGDWTEYMTLKEAEEIYNKIRE